MTHSGKLTVKTRALNFIRKAFTNHVAEKLLLMISPGSKPNSFFAKLIPMPYLYRSPAIRKAVRNGIQYELDIADLVDWHIFFSLWDEALEALFNLIDKHNVVIDIGANIGYTILSAAQRATEGTVIGFEPNKTNFDKCQKNISLNNFTNVKVENLAIGETNFKTSIKVRDQHNRGMNQIEENCDGSIQAISLDHWMTVNNQQKVDLIKIDVEGYELKVLKGATNTIKSSKPKLFIELDDNNLKHYGDSASALLQFLFSSGYQVTDISGKEIHTDLLFANCHLDIIALPK